MKHPVPRVFKVKSRVKTWQGRGIWSQQSEHKQVPKRVRDQLSGRVSAPCWHDTPVANAPLKPLNSLEVNFGRVIKSV